MGATGLQIIHLEKASLLASHIFQLFFFPGCLSFAMGSPHHPGRRWLSISGADVAYQGSCPPGSHCWCWSGSLPSALEKPNVASEQGGKHIIRQMSSAAG